MPLGVIQNPYYAPSGQLYANEDTYRRQQLLDRFLSEGRQSGLSQGQYNWLVGNGYKSMITPDMLKESSRAWFANPTVISEADQSAFNSAYPLPRGTETQAEKVLKMLQQHTDEPGTLADIQAQLAQGKTPADIFNAHTFRPTGVPTAPNLFQQPAPMIQPQQPATQTATGRTPPQATVPMATNAALPMAVPQYNAGQQARVDQINASTRQNFGTVVPSTVTYGQRPTRMKTYA